MSGVTPQFGSNGHFAGKSRKLHVGELVRNYASAWRVEQLEGEAKLAEGSGGEARRKSKRKREERLKVKAAA